MYDEFRKQNKFRSDMYYIERDTTATRDRIIELVKESDYNYDYCVAAVKRDGTILKALKNVESITQLQYLDLYEYAVKQNGMAIEYVPTHCQSYVITRYAVDQNPKAITKITDKTMRDLILDKRGANINTISDLQVLCDVFDTNPSLVTEERIHNICVCIEKQNRNDAWTADADAYRDAVNTIVSRAIRMRSADAINRLKYDLVDLQHDNICAKLPCKCFDDYVFCKSIVGKIEDAIENIPSVSGDGRLLRTTDVLVDAVKAFPMNYIKLGSFERTLPDVMIAVIRVGDDAILYSHEHCAELFDEVFASMIRKSEEECFIVPGKLIECIIYDTMKHSMISQTRKECCDKFIKETYKQLKKNSAKFSQQSKKLIRCRKWGRKLPPRIYGED